MPLKESHVQSSGKNQKKVNYQQGSPKFKTIRYEVLLDNGTSRSLHDGDNVIGRIGNVDIAVPNDSYMSRKHAVLTIGKGDCFIRDINSKNGSLVNGRRISTSPEKIYPGDKFVCGRTNFILTRKD
jgi:pSer/pThr/pTyr-binding forkhead associated (FHA) protein